MEITGLCVCFFLVVSFFYMGETRAGKRCRASARGARPLGNPGGEGERDRLGWGEGFFFPLVLVASDRIRDLAPDRDRALEWPMELEVVER